MIGPRDSLVREALGETVPLDEFLRDKSEFIDTDAWFHCEWHELPPEFWAQNIHDFVAEEWCEGA